MDPGEDIAEEVRSKLTKNYARFFGFEVVEARPGAVTLALPHRSEFEHAENHFEGVVTNAIGQIAASYSGASMCEDGWRHSVLSHSMSYLAAAKGERLVAVGKVTASGRSISFTAADVFVECGGDRALCGHLAMVMSHAPPRDPGLPRAAGER